jgi:hypothetical protein
MPAEAAVMAGWRLQFADEDIDRFRIAKYE